MFDALGSYIFAVLKEHRLDVPGLRKGKRIARWVTSHLSKDSDRAMRDKPPEAEVRLHIA